MDKIDLLKEKNTDFRAVYVLRDVDCGTACLKFPQKIKLLTTCTRPEMWDNTLLFIYSKALFEYILDQCGAVILL